jgi:precorrin-6B methylase 2
MRALLGLLAALAVASAGRAQDAEWRVPFITTPDEVVARMLALAGTRADDYVVDLGSGDGRIVIAAARRFGARALGIELDGELVKASQQNARRAGVADRARFVQGDVLTADFSAASVVTVYLLPDLIGKLQSRFVTELKPGTRIVSHAFRMSGWTPVASETLRVAGPHPGQGDESTLYLWIVPAEVRGLWSGGGMRVRIDQSYGDIDVEGATQATLRGTDIAWSSPQGSFRGQVRGARIVGELSAGGRSTPVVLER